MEFQTNRVKKLIAGTVAMSGEQHADRTQEIAHQAFLALEALPDAVAVVDAEGRVLCASKAFRRRLALPDDAATIPLDNLFEHCSALRAIADALKRCLKTAVGEGFTLEPGKHNGDAMSTQAAIVPLGAQEPPDAFLVRLSECKAAEHATDETEHLYEALEYKIQELEAANTGLENFAHSVSHDLRAPLRFITKFAHLLITEHAAELSPKALNYAESIQVGTRQMGQLIEDLLHFSRALKEPLEKRETDLAQLAKEVAAELEPGQDGQEIELTVGDLGIALVGPSLVRQVFANLIDNAIKFTMPRERAVIEVGSESDPTSGPRYYVRDNGVGFPQEMAEELFVVFKRCHKPEEFEGTGVGLALVKQIVERHGGRVWAEGEEDKGATFWFTLTSGVSPEAQAVLDDIEGEGDASDQDSCG